MSCSGVSSSCSCMCSETAPMQSCASQTPNDYKNPTDAPLFIFVDRPSAAGQHDLSASPHILAGHIYRCVGKQKTSHMMHIMSVNVASFVHQRALSTSLLAAGVCNAIS